MATPVHHGGSGGSGKANPPKGGGGSGSGGSGGSSGGGGGSDISGAERRANAKENAAKRKAAQKYRDQAKTLEEQVQAIRRSLGKGGYLKALTERLKNADLVYKQQDSTIVEGYNSRVGDLKGAQRDNQRALGDTSYANLANRGRERVAALKEASLHGAGESDTLAAQVMSLRTWDANQGEANRSFFDTLRSVNSSLGDLNVDTKTARLNAASQLNNDKDQLYTQYFNDKSEAYTQLGNLRGQQAELYGLAAEQGSGKSKGDQKRATKNSGSAFDKASQYVAKVHKNPGAPKKLKDWNGTADFEGIANNAQFDNAATNIAETKRPEGAKLRSW